MSQADLILNHLKNGNTLTPLEALGKFGCFRLAARIHDLRTAGHDIEKTDGGDGFTHWAIYSLNEENQRGN